jgi:hypothetical protein
MLEAHSAAKERRLQRQLQLATDKIDQLLE